MTWPALANLARVVRAMLLLAVAFLAVSLLAVAHNARAANLGDEDIGRHGRALIFGSEEEREAALDALVAHGGKGSIATIVLAMRYRRGDPGLTSAFKALSGEMAAGWFDAMVWLERHPEAKPHASYRDLKLEVFERLDPQFLRFLGGKRSLPKNLKIRLEEITWGGVAVDEIPSLDYPKLIRASEASYLRDEDLVFGVAINGDVRAYPLRIMGWHEMFNDVIGDVPVALAYCTLCGAGILFETKVASREQPFIFGSSGFLYRSNKLMFDRSTDSLWNQFTGEPVSGPLRNDGLKLKMRPVTITSWANWKARHPSTRVLSLETGYQRDYDSGVVYRDYFASPDLMFPASTNAESPLKPKNFVFGIRDVGAAKAWPLSAFEGGAVINDAVGGRNVILIGDAATRSVRAYERDGRRFAPGDDDMHLSGPGGAWRIREEFLLGPEGTRLARIPGHISYWFAWDSYLGVKSELYRPGSAVP